MGRIQKSWPVLVVLILVISEGRTQAADKEDIVGRWNYVQDDRYYLRLNADGTFKLVMGWSTIEGNYRVLDGGYIEVDTPGLIWGRNKEEIKYRLSGDTLEFKVGANLGKYQRVK